MPTMRRRWTLFTSIYLKLLVEMTTEGEVRADNPLFRPDDLLTQHDYQRLEQARRWKTPHDLPTRVILVGKLRAQGLRPEAKRWLPSPACRRGVGGEGSGEGSDSGSRTVRLSPGQAG